MEKEEIVKYLIEKGYPVTTGGDIPTFEQSMEAMTDLYNYKKSEWMETACKWLINIDFDGYDFRNCDESFDNDLFVDAFRKAMEK